MQILFITTACLSITAIICLIAVVWHKRRKEESDREREQQLALVTEQRDAAAEERQALSAQVQSLESRLTEVVAEAEQAKLERAPYAICREPAEINSFVGSILAEFRTLLMERGVHLSFEPAEGFTNILVDHYLLDRIVSMLFSNAIEATPRGREVSVKVKLDTGRLSISVRDGGGLISVGEGSESRQLSATYQLVALIKRLAEIHGGSVVIQNRSDGGIVAVNIDAAPAGNQTIPATG